jgi:two-component system, NarL family, nitrate/nitrite response regulator NarL
MVPNVPLLKQVKEFLMRASFSSMIRADMNEPSQDIQILIADERAMFREALRDLLAEQPGLNVIGEAASGTEAVRQASRLHPNILLLDLCTPCSSGMETLRGLAKDALTVRTIIFADGADKSHIIEALKLGARGIVEKQTSSQLLLKSIRAVAAGEYWVAHGNMPALIAHLQNPAAADGNGKMIDGHPLTAREVEMVSAIADGLTNKEIAQKFGISEQTVKHHLTSVFEKVGVSNRLELALFAMHQTLE